MANWLFSMLLRCCSCYCCCATGHTWSKWNLCRLALSLSLLSTCCCGCMTKCKRWFSHVEAGIGFPKCTLHTLHSSWQYYFDFSLIKLNGEIILKWWSLGERARERERKDCLSGELKCITRARCGHEIIFNFLIRYLLKRLRGCWWEFIEMFRLIKTVLWWSSATGWCN